MSTPIAHTMLPRIGDGSMNKLIDLIERTLNRLESHPFANLKILQPIAFTAATPLRVTHGLGYPMTGVFVVSASTPMSVSVPGIADADPNNFVVLTPSATGSATLAVF